MTAKQSWKLQQFAGHSSMVTCASLGHKSGRVMGTGGEDGKVNLWHIGSPNCVMSLSPLPSAVEVVQFNTTEELICAGSRSGALRIWDLAASKVMRQLTGHKAAVRSLDFHPYGDFVVSGAVDHKVRMWDIRRKGCIFTYKGHEGQVNAVEFSPDGRWISSVSDDETCKIWNITAGKLLHELKDHKAPISCLQFHPNEFLLATGSHDRTSIVYDVENIEVVSKSPPEASPIQHVIFDDSGKFLFTASQDCCKIYSWEPKCIRLDTVLVKWGKPSDVTISADQLMGCSFSQNLVSVHIVDTKQLRKTPSNDVDDEISNEPTIVKQAITPRRSHVTTRPHTSCGVTTMTTPLSPSVPPVIHCNNNNSQSPFKDIDASDPSKVFTPTTTLSRSPLKQRENESPDTKTNKKADNNESDSVSTPSAPPRVSSSQPSIPAAEPVRWNNAVTRKVPSKSNDSKAPNEVVSVKKQLAPVDIKDTPPLGGALNWVEPNSIKKNENIPEKPGVVARSESTTSVASNPPAPVQPPPANQLTFVPDQRQDPIGLDMNAFLPAKRENVSMSSATKSDAEAISTIRKGFDSMRVVLTSRHKNLDVVRALWTSGDIMTSIVAAIKMDDQALVVDLLNVLTLKPSLWNLDLCLVMLPQIKNLVGSRYESYASVGCQSLKLVLKNFAQVIRSNLKPPPHNAVDLSREERHKKCKACYIQLTEIRSALDAKQQTVGKVGSQFRELKILINTLD